MPPGDSRRSASLRELSSQVTDRCFGSFLATSDSAEVGYRPFHRSHEKRLAQHLQPVDLVEFCRSEGPFEADADNVLFASDHLNTHPGELRLSRAIVGHLRPLAELSRHRHEIRHLYIVVGMNPRFGRQRRHATACKWRLGRHFFLHETTYYAIYAS
jgi:hypothetical protein